jgi:predicted N-acetyltransferase YhbS
MIEITQEHQTDAGAIEGLLDRAFGADRFKKRSYGFRDGIARLDALSLAARDGDRLVGTIRYWPILIGAAGVPALLLGPVAIEAEYRLHGLGATLIRRSLAEAANLGHRLIVLVGDQAYYGRFGFRHASEWGIAMPLENAARVQLLDLAPELPAATLADGTIRRWVPRVLATAA